MSIKRTIITTLVALALVAVVAPVVGAQSMTVAQLQAEIAQLTSQLSQLSGTTAPATTASGTGACAGVTFTRNLKVGSSGSDVKCLQQILSVTPMSGYFGPKTLAAVQAYQTAQGLTPAAQVGPMTRAKLNASLGAPVVVLPGQPVQPGQPVITPTGSITAVVASDSPAAGAIVNGQATADLLHINFTGTGTVTSVTLQRTGISDQNALTNVYLYDGNTRLTSGYSFNCYKRLTRNFC
jgi:peptidoglycan hydrolase-like protein with peptidoglycan-binding domain